MPQYLILAKDGKDNEAPNRREAARPFHLETVKALKANENFIIGGATLNENGEMNGSMMVVEFENETALNEWLQNDPYVRKGVWEDFEVKPFRIANV